MTPDEKRRADANRRQREWYQRNKEKAQAYGRERFQRLRAEMVELLGAVCRQCGYSDQRALEIDHVVPVRHRSGGKEWHREMSNIRANPHQYQLLCANCHTIKSKGER